MTYDTRIIAGLPASDYHAGPELSNSGISDLLKSPLHYWRRHCDPHRPAKDETAGQRHGTVAHAAILEPDTFADRFPVLPYPDRRTKAAKEWIEALRPEQTAITEAERDTALRQRENVLALPDVAQALARGMPEISAYWTDAATGTSCRCRPDWVHYSGDAGVVLLDVKTCPDASPAEFARQVARMGYHRQAAFYSAGYGIASGKPVLAFIFVTVETQWPYAASAHLLDDAALEQGERECRRALKLHARCLADNHWPGYPTGISTISLPAWALEEPL